MGAEAFDTLQYSPKPSGMREIFSFVVVEQVDETWQMHWAPRNEQSIAICGKTTMPSVFDPDHWGEGHFKWCGECARLKKLILPLQG